MSNKSILFILKEKLSNLKSNDITVRTDIQSIICNVLNVDRAYLYLYGDKALTDNQVEEIEEKVARYEQGEPLAYILGYKYFWKQKIFVNQHTLIPRADTETLIEAVLNDYLNKDEALDILDLGTGSGAIAIALAAEYPNSNVVAVDFSKEALKQSEINAKQNSVDNIKFIESDWYENLAKYKFDIIVSNPPYIDIEDSEIDDEVKKYEPHSALFANDGGLADIELIISKAQDFLKNSHGKLYIEHGYTQSEVIYKLFANAGFLDIRVIKDLNGRDRTSVAKK
ncbi:peptide chain release factor N(5)-glutamine methyltransferase [Francisella frigiditurris]|uniref:Release factor glutamine methyltransferase n=1 Tax=Francisella frigiditurris TaxID=1542390 RepID=A0A1J0KRY0_9GAMM|nr:peptide chain release factor N(5)-glutamine methyltransferase [Francisella frigiditurris]APC96544.1 protein-(glutamine-N5) methyltransferase, release factor-specific [Francisella frigiditurris]